MKTISTLFFLLVLSGGLYAEGSGRISNSFNSRAKGFIENKGQWSEDVLFVSRQDNYDILVARDGLIFDFYSLEDGGKKGHVVKYVLPGGISADKIKYDAASPTVYNYIYGKDPSKWQTNVREFSSVTVENIIDKISLKLYSEKGMPRYDFVLAPGADPSDLSFEIVGAEKVKSKGDKITFVTSLGEIDNRELFTYQGSGSDRIAVSSKFRVSGNRVSFDIGNYDKSKPLVIDPVVYASFFGTSGDDMITCTATLSNTEYVIGGHVSAEGLNTTPGAYRTVYGGSKDGFVAKMKFSGAQVSMEYLSFIGSTEDDFVTDIGTDNNDNIYVAGYTKSSDFPEYKGVVALSKGDNDGFIMKFTPNFAQLSYSTIVSGTNDDRINAIFVEPNGAVYMTGQTKSNNFPRANGITARKYASDFDAFITRITADGKAIDLSMPLGGEGEDIGRDVYIDPVSNNIYLTGSTNSTGGSNNDDFPLEPSGGTSWQPGSPFDKSPNGGLDAFAMELTANGADVRASTFFGGTKDDIGMRIFKAEGGGILFFGHTQKEIGETTFPVSESAAQKVNSGGYDLFYAKLKDLEKVPFTTNVFVQKLDFSTMYGGKSDDEIYDVLLNSNTGQFVAIGSTKSSNYPRNSDMGTGYKGGSDIFVTEFPQNDPSAGVSSVFGDKFDEVGRGFAYDAFSNLLIVGTTNTSTYPVSNNAYNSTLNGKVDGLMFKLSSGDIATTSPNTGDKYCKGGTMDITWTETNMPVNAKYDIILVDAEGNLVKEVAKQVGNTGYIYEIPSDIESGKSYRVIVSHESGVFYPTGLFTMLEAPKVTLPTTKIEICNGGDISVEPTASGDELVYTWKFNGSTIVQAGADKQVLNINDISKSKAGEYVLEVKGYCNPVAVSPKLTVVVFDSTAVTEELQNNSVFETQPFEFNVKSVGHKMTYQWQKNEQDIIGETNPKFKVNSAASADAGNYRCIVNGTCGSDTTNEATLTVEPASVKYDDVTASGILGVSISQYANSIDMDIQAMADMEADIMLFDNMGNAVANVFSGNIASGSSKHTINTAGLASGFYIVGFNTSKGHFTYKINYVK